MGKISEERQFTGRVKRKRRRVEDKMSMDKFSKEEETGSLGLGNMKWRAKNGCKQNIKVKWSLNGDVGGCYCPLKLLLRSSSL